MTAFIYLVPNLGEGGGVGLLRGLLIGSWEYRVPPMVDGP